MAIHAKMKRKINRLAFDHVGTYGFSTFQEEDFHQWRSSKERKIDELVQVYPLLHWVRWLITPYYLLSKIWHVVYVVIWGLLLFLLFEPAMALGWLIAVYIGGLLLVTVGVRIYQKTWQLLTPQSSFGQYKKELVRMLNHVVQLVTSDPNLSSYYVAEGKHHPEWFHIYLYTNQPNTEQGIDKFQLESVFKKEVHNLNNDPKYIHFQINLLSEDIHPEGSQPMGTSTTPPKKLTAEERKQQLQESLNELNEMVGLQPVKEYISELHDWVTLEQERSELGQATSGQSLHMIFSGNPGTGKTTVARIVAKILHSLGVVSKGHLVEVDREQLVGEYIGQTAPKTKKVVQSAIGGVLFIDEAYALSRGGSNDFGKEAVDTLVKGMEEYRSDLVVILAGYTKEMNEFLKTNSGLKSRFPNIIEFPDYTAEELLQLAKFQLNKDSMTLTPKAEQSLLGVLQRKQIAGRNDDGNGRLVRNVIQETVRRQSRRLKRLNNFTKDDLQMLLPEDIDAEATKPSFDMEAEFTKIIGNEEVKQHIRSLIAQIRIQKKREAQGLSQAGGQSLHMVFTGNPGTGKTTFARLLGKVLKEMGMLKSGQLIETDRSGLVAGYIGQTATKVNDVIQEALGGILFIDEAYSLIPKGESDFSQEAIDALVKGMEDHRENLVVILAGYSNEMNRFFGVNSGLHSRFPHTFHFANYTAKELFRILQIIVQGQNYRLADDCQEKLIPLLTQEANDPQSSNGRFVRNLFEQAVRNQAVRLDQKAHLDSEDLTLLVADDFLG